MYLIPLNCHLKIAKSVSFMLYVFYQVKDLNIVCNDVSKRQLLTHRPEGVEDLR